MAEAFMTVDGVREEEGIAELRFKALIAAEAMQVGVSDLLLMHVLYF